METKTVIQFYYHSHKWWIDKKAASYHSINVNKVINLSLAFISFFPN